MVASRRKKVAGKGSSYTLLGDYTPRLTSRSCGEFPGIGRTFAFAPLPPVHEPAVHFQSASSCLRPGSCTTCHIFGAFFRSKFLFQSLPRRGWPRLPVGSTGAGAFFAAGAHCVTGKYFSPCRTASAPSSRCSTRTFAPRNPLTTARGTI